MTRKYISGLLVGCLLASISPSIAQSPRNYPPYAEEFQKVLEDGANSQFAESIISHEGNIFGAFINSKGDIVSFRHKANGTNLERAIVVTSVSINSHMAPSICAMKDGRIALFYSKPGKGVYCTTTTRPGEITSWTSPTIIISAQKGSTEEVCPTGVWIKNRLYLFFRDYKGGISYTTSPNASIWDTPKTFVSPSTTGRHPYFKILVDKRNSIHLLISESSPSEEFASSIYYIKYHNGTFYHANGRKVALAKLSLEQADKIYDATISTNKSSIWDLAINKNGYPCIVYSHFAHTNGMHSYWYASWDGEKWNSSKICDAYNCFPRNKKDADKNFISSEIYESGGICLDPLNPTTVYLSRPTNNVFEIEEWTQSENNARWRQSYITEKSEKDNIHPQAVYISEKEPVCLYWCYNYHYSGKESFLSSVRSNQRFKGFNDSFSSPNILEVAKAVADWQIRSYKEEPFSSGVARGWRSGVLYNGFFDWAELYEKTTGDSKYFEFLKSIFAKEHWAVGNLVYHADHLCVGQVYLDMYQKYQDKSMMLSTLARTSWVIENQPRPNIDNTKGKSDRWWWCDALYMAPAVYTRLYTLTGDERFIKFADKEFKACYNQLYDTQEQLFFRDSKYLNRRERNGQKVFWGRGNGWVLGGLAEILKTLPRNDQTYRPFYEKLFKEMCNRIATLQSTNGFWHASLLDTDAYPDPENSATTLFTYAMAYGVNEGLLPAEKYLPVIRKGWTAIVSSVDSEGKLGWVQPVGEAPKRIEKRSTQLYGVGGLLMTACEIYKMSNLTK